MSAPRYKIYGVKTTVGQEKNVVRIIESRLNEFFVSIAGEIGGAYGICDNDKACQLFRAPRTTEIATVSVYASKEGEADGSLLVELYQFNEEASEVGEKITSAECSAEKIPAEATWCDVKLEPALRVERDKVYAVVISAPSCSKGRYLWYRTSSKLYADGKAMTSASEGGWTEEDFDFLLRIGEKELEVSSILILPNVRGYVFLESSDRDKVATLTQGIKHVKSKPLVAVSIEELAPHMIERPLIDVIEAGEEVEVVAGPLKGMTGKVVRVDKLKKEVTIELKESAYLLPIAVPINHVRPVERRV